MKVTIILGKSTIHRDIPISWEQVTFGQFLELGKCGNNKIKQIAFFTGTDYELLRKARIVDIDTVLNVLNFLTVRHELLHIDDEHPLTLEIITRHLPKKILKYALPKDLKSEEVQLYLDLQNYVFETGKLPKEEQLARYTIYCAIYACSAPNAYGKYDWEYAEKMKDEFLHAPCVEVLAVGNFTLLKLIALNLSTGQTSPKASYLIKKFRLVLAGWRIRMVLFLRSFNLKKKLV